MKTKRFVSWLLVITLVISLLPGSIFTVSAVEASSDAVVSVRDAYTKPGAIVNVDVMIENNPGILGMTLKLQFDDDIATLTEVVGGDALSNMTFTPPKGEGLKNGCTLLWDAESVDAENVKDGIIATLTFQIADDAQPDEIMDVSVSAVGEILDADAQPLNVTMVTGQVQILTYTPGDVNDDGQVTSTDVVYLRRYIAGGYGITINEAAGDVNNDGVLTSTDVVYIRRYIVGGYGIILRPSIPKCDHTMQATNAKDATCTEDGNTAYWYCENCQKYFKDADGESEITIADTVITATGHEYSEQWSYDQTYHWHAATCEHTDLVTDRAEHTIGTDKLCKECGMSNAPDPTKPYIITYKLVEYNKQNGDTYLETLNIDNSQNRTWFSATDSFELVDPTCGEAYTFNGWYTEDGTKFTKISAGTKEDIVLYARWTERTFTITYNVYNTPVGAITDESKKTYKPSQGLAELPKPELNNYIWQGWFFEDGTEATNIPIGTTGNIVLIPHLTNERNLAIPKKDSQPLVVEDTENGVILFAYELGTIKNVPLTSALWEIQSVAGLEQQQSKTYTSEIGSEKAVEITDMISDTTVDSSTWTLSENWTDTVEVNEAWAQENSVDTETAKEQMLTDANTLSLTNSQGVANTSTHSSGITTSMDTSLDIGRETGSHFDVNLDAKYSNTLETSLGFSAGLKVPLNGGAEVNAGINAGIKNTSTFELGLGVEYGNYDKNSTNIHVGTESTKVDTNVNSNTASWNSSATSARTQEISQSESIREALKEVISTTKGYGKTYSSGGEGSSTQGTSFSESNSTTTSSSLVYKSTVIEETYQMQKADGKIEGKYRLVIAGDIHVFAVVGYDAASKSYFTYTYNILDDDTYSFLDYTPKGGDYGVEVYDYENSVLPFEIPYFVHEYVTSKTAVTEGVEYSVDSVTGTATVDNYVESAGVTDVIIPSYISAGGNAYRVTGINVTAFAGKNVRSVALSDFITEIPSGAFKDCTALEQISGRFTTIGDNAFSGCTSLEDFIVSPAVSFIGENAFKDVPSISMTVLNEEYALIAAEAAHPDITDTDEEELRRKLAPYADEITKQVIQSAAKSGAENIVMDISQIATDKVPALDIPAITSFELVGDKKATYTELKIISWADTTKLRYLTVADCTRVPLEIKNGDLILDTVNITAPSFVLLLAKDGATISLLRDSKLTAQGGNAVVAKNPVINSVKEENVWGTLSVSGNFYYYGTKPDSIRMKMASGELIPLTKVEFESYIQGCYKITFNPNGGSVDKTEMTAFVGQSLGALPVPNRTGHNFVGWFDSNGVLVTETTSFASVQDITLTAKWSAMAYTATWTAGTGYTITVKRTSSPYAGATTGNLSSGEAIYHGDVLSITYAASTGYSLGNKGKTSITVTGNVTSSDIYTSASVNSYSVSWDNGTGYTIAVKRTSSPLKGASTEALDNGATIYYGDVLSVTYTASTGYSLGSKGSTSITVTGNVTKDHVYTSASLNSYTYKVVYVSSNGTDLGGTEVTYKYGTTNTISAPAKSGYTTPSSQSVKWDSTSAKTITFTYTPSDVSTSQELASGWWWQGNYADTGVSFSVTAEYRNRNKNSVEIRILWTQSIKSAMYGVDQYAYVSLWQDSEKVADTGNMHLVSYAKWNGSYYTGSVTHDSGWITVPLNTTNATTIGVACDWWDQWRSGSWANKNILVPAF